MGRHLKRGERKRKRPFAGHALEPFERRVLLSSIIGTLWHDANENGVREGTEPALAGWTVYLDQNRNRRFDGSELSDITDGSGGYEFTGLAAGTYYVAQQIPPGWKQTHPDAGGAMLGPADADLPALALSYTGSEITARISASPTEGSGPGTAMVGASPLIRLNSFRADARFSGIGGQGFAIAVLDTGIDLDHSYFGPDSDHNGVADRIIFQYDFVHDDSNANDENGHGTHVSGIAAGQDITFGGIAPEAPIIALQVLDGGGAGTFGDIEQALQWVAANATLYNIAAVNMSLGDLQNYATPQQLHGIGDEMASLAAQNVLVVSASGNDYGAVQSQGVTYPAADPNSLAVGAVYDSNVGSQTFGSGAIDHTSAPDRIAAFSQRSASLSDVFAPGVEITAAGWGGGAITLSGTSMASPIIAGVAALAQQLAVRDLGRRLTLDEFRDLIANTSAVIFDGDDEDDSVVNSLEFYRRIDVQALAEAIYEMGGSSYVEGHVVVLADGQIAGAKDFGATTRSLSLGVPDLVQVSDTGTPADNITKLDNSSADRRLVFMVQGTIPGATIKLLADGQEIGSVVAEFDVAAVFTDGSIDLSEGVHSITAQQSVPGLPAGPVSGSLSITVDTIGPAPVLFDLLPSSDSGISDSDNITNSTVLEFSTNAAELVQVYRYGLPVYSTYSAGVITMPATNEGVHSLTVIARDVAGNETAPSSPLVVTVDRTAFPSAGVIDASFGASGIAKPPPVSGEDVFNAVAAQSDGKIVAVGQKVNFAIGDGSIHPNVMSIVRFNVDGSVDATFGVNGEVSQTILFVSELRDVVVLPGGKILAGGMVGNGSIGPFGISAQPEFLLVQLNFDGSLDSTFGSGGYVISRVGSGFCDLSDIAVTPTGKIIVCGTAKGAAGDIAVAQYSANGALEWLRLVDFAGRVDSGSAVALAPDGKIVVIGTTQSVSVQTGLVARLDQFGAIDPLFDGDGKLETQLTTGQFDWDFPHAVAVYPDGAILVGGYTNHNSQFPGFLIKYRPDGQRDGTFGSSGLIFGTTLRGPNSISVMPDGSFWWSSNRSTGVGSGLHTVGHFFQDGSPDPAFAPGGMLTIPGKSNDHVVLPNGNIVTVGMVEEPSSGWDRYARRFYPMPQTMPTLALHFISDTGVSRTDRVTRDTTPTLILPSPASHYARVFRDGVLVGPSYTPNAIFTAPIQPDGPALWTASVVDAAGNVGAVSAPITIVIDTAPPVFTGAFLVNSLPHTLQLTFDEPIASSLHSSSLVIRNQHLQIIPAGSPTYNTGLRQASWTFGSPLPDGIYTASLAANSFVDTAGNASVGSYEFFSLAADANRDRVVDARDLVILSQNWYGTGKTFTEGDFNYDGIVNALDLTLMAQRWQQNLNLAPPPPAPGSPPPTIATRRAPIRTPVRAIGLVT